MYGIEACHSQDASKLKVDVHAGGYPELVNQTSCECEIGSGTGCPGRNSGFIGEVACIQSHTGEEYSVVYAVLLISADPVGHVQHSIHVSVKERPFDLLVSADSIEVSALQSGPDTHYWMQPFSNAELSVNTEPVSPCTLIVAAVY